MPYIPGQLANAGVKRGYVPGAPSRKKKEKKPDVSELEGLIDFAESKGFHREAEAARSGPKLSFLQRLGRALTAFETGNAFAAQLEGGSFFKTYASDIGTGLSEALMGKNLRTTPKRIFKDVLKEQWKMTDRAGKLDAVDVVGFVADILTDPTTYFGGFIAKGAVKTVGKVGSKTIKFTGKTPGLRGVTRTAEGAVEGFRRAFQPFREIEQKLGEKGIKYRAHFEKYAKGTRAEVDDYLKGVQQKSRAARKAVGPEAGARIARAVETGTRTGNKLLDEVMDNMTALQKKFTKQEVERGILEHQLPDYMHHMLTPDASDYLSKGGNLTAFVKPIRVKLGAAKPRKIEGIVKEINEGFRKKMGFDLFEENAFKAFGKRGVDSIRAINTHDFLTRIGYTFGKKAEKDFVDKFGVKWTSSGAKELKGIKLPEPIVGHIDEMRKFLSNDEATNQFLRVYDKALNFWKGTVTGWFPAFHTRNMTGAVFNNFIAGLKNPLIYKDSINVLRGADGKIAVKGGKEMSYGTIRGLLKEYGVIGQAGFLDSVKYLQREIDPSYMTRIARFPQRVMTHGVENPVRSALFIDGLKKGMSPEKAARRVLKYHFDYMPEGFTAFERNIMKRAIPFYTWTRHNIPLQLEQLVMQPAKYGAVFKMHRSFGMRPGADEDRYLPDWMRERFTVGNEGNFWSGVGTPLEEMTEKLAQPLRGFGISLSPFLRVPIEQLTGYNIFKDMEINEDRWGKTYKNMPKPVKDWLELKEHTSKKTGKKYWTLNPRRKYWLEVIGARGISTAGRVSNYTDDKANLLSLITTIKKYDYSLEDIKRWSDNDLREELERVLIEAGELGEFKRVYVKD